MESISEQKKKEIPEEGPCSETEVISPNDYDEIKTLILFCFL